MKTSGAGLEGGAEIILIECSHQPNEVGTVCAIKAACKNIDEKAEKEQEIGTKMIEEISTLCMPVATNRCKEGQSLARATGEQGKSVNIVRYPQDREQKGEELPTGPQLESIKPTKKRYFILLMYFILRLINSFQWICLASVTNIVAKFYDVDNLAINWTAMLFMVTFLTVGLPVSWLMDSIGLRRSVLIGSFGLSLGVTIKCFSCTRQGFALGMIGHLLIGLTEPFYISSYSQLSSTWFPDDQVSMATATSIIGEQAGMALGFIIPPLMLGGDANDFDTIQTGLSRLFLTVAAISILNTIATVLFFDEKPTHPPGIARQKQMEQNTLRRQSSCNIMAAAKGLPDSEPTKSSSEPALTGGGRKLSRVMGQNLREQMKLTGEFLLQKDFLLLLTAFGILQGISYSFHTLLNQMIVGPTNEQAPWPPEEPSNNSSLSPEVATITQLTRGSDLFPRWKQDEATVIVGNAGLILVLSGLAGSGFCGFILDRCHRYKLTTLLVYLGAIISIGALSVCLFLGNELNLYLVCIPFGFMLTGYSTCGFEYAVEISYPKPELLSSTLLNISAQVFGIPISLLGSAIVDTYGSQSLCYFFCSMMLIGFILTAMQGGRLRRQEAIEASKSQQVHEQQS